ncbi:MAG: leucine-rich repeat domain-containing protein [Aureispira sp.]
MTVYLEYNDEKSSKFWTITLQDNNHTVTYGKVGTQGQSKTKTFDSVEKAQKDAEKLVKAKRKKGYQEANTDQEKETTSPEITPNTTADAPLQITFLEEEEAEERFEFGQYEPLGDIEYDAIAVIEGDTIIHQTIDDDSIEAIFFDNNRTSEQELIIINGNLTVKGAINIEEDMPSLLVIGDLHCEVLHGKDSCIDVTGDAHIQYVFDGNYNHGSVMVHGTTYVPYILNSDHCSTLTPSKKAILINYYNQQDDFFTYDYYRSDLANILVKGLAEIEDEDASLDVEAFIKRVRSGKSPFKKGVKPSRVLVEQEIKKLAKKSKATGGIKTLDLTEKKLLNLPSALFELKDLETLTLESNSFDSIPSNLGELTNLKELNLKSTGIKSLPESIGQLKQLEVLNLSYCHHLKALPKAIGELTNLKKLVLWRYKGEIPESITQLTNLEELDIHGRYGNGVEPTDFPSWICHLKGLKTLKAGYNAFKNIPQEFLQLSNLETLELHSALSCLEEIADLSPLSSLKNVDIDGAGLGNYPNPPHDILQHFFKISSLEVLKMTSFSAKEEWMPNSTVEENRAALKDQPEQLAAFESRLRANNSNQYYYQTRRNITVEDFKGIEQLTNLKELDIAWNELETIPEEFLQLQHLEHVRIYGNNLSKEAKEALYGLNPKMRFS